MSTDSNPTTDRLADPIVLLFERSPYGTLDAIVQHDGKAVYFYLNEPKTDRPPLFGTRACWVRNLELGPMVVNEDEMKQGVSPMLPRTQCVNRMAQPVPDPERLSVVWLEEGNGAALIEDSPETDAGLRTIALIPPWSGLEGFHGYAAQCAVESPLCWPMPDNPKLRQRIDLARRFWDHWRSKEDNPFASLQPQILSAFDRSFGAENQQGYFSIDGGAFPPRGLVQYEIQAQDSGAAEIVLATVGMSICPQPAVEIFTDDPTNFRRIELAIRVPRERFSPASEKDDPPATGKLSLETLQRNLSGLASYPWTDFTWLGPGHTCGLVGAEPGCQSALLISDQQLASPSPMELPEFRGDPINLLWLFPLHAQQQQLLQSNEMTVEQFLANLN